MRNEHGKQLLDVRGLTANVAGVPILKGVDLDVREGEIHAIMGPNSWQIISMENACYLCNGSGKEGSRVCNICRGKGWNLIGKTTGN